VYLLEYAGTQRPAHRGGPSDRTVTGVIRAILTFIVLVPFAAGTLLTFALLLAGGAETISHWVR